MMMMRKWRQLESVFVVVVAELVVALVAALAVAMQNSLLVTAVTVVIVVIVVTIFAIVAVAVAVVALESRDGCENRYRATTECDSPGPLAHKNAVSTDTAPHSSSTPPYGYHTAEIDIDTVSPYTVD